VRKKCTLVRHDDIGGKRSAMRCDLSTYLPGTSGWFQESPSLSRAESQQAQVIEIGVLRAGILKLCLSIAKFSFRISSSSCRICNSWRSVSVSFRWGGVSVSECLASVFLQRGGAIAGLFLVSIRHFQFLTRSPCTCISMPAGQRHPPEGPHAKCEKKRISKVSLELLNKRFLSL